METVSAWLSRHALPFATAQPGNGITDLLFLREVIGDARIVALGEATHGTHEFFAMKHRIVELLTTELGFNLFAMEAPWTEAQFIDRYLQTEKGDLDGLLTGLRFWPWNTQEVSALIRWMRDYNTRPDTHSMLQFSGFDMQFPQMPMDSVIAYLKNADARAAHRAETLYASFRDYQQGRAKYFTASEERKVQCRRNLRAVYEALERQRARYEAVTSPQAFAETLQNARIVLQAEEVSSSRDPSVRDRCMAENVAWLLERAGPNAKIMLWAHNAHIAAQTSASMQSMGAYLRERYGHTLVLFGFDFFCGSFNAIQFDSEAGQYHGLRIHQAPPPPSDSYEAGFGSTGIPRMMIDLRSVQPGSPATDWLLGPRRFRRIGAVYDPAQPDLYYTPISLPQHFDILVYFRDTSPSQPLPIHSRQDHDP